MKYPILDIACIIRDFREIQCITRSLVVTINVQNDLYKQITDS